jgi:transcriptional regulator with XRE-family HTH domain
MRHELPAGTVRHGLRSPVSKRPSTSIDDAEADKELGRRIRKLRTAKQLSLREAAGAASVSESFLSQVERGVANPSVASLRRIAEALGEPVASFFAGGRADGMLVRRDDRRRLQHPLGAWEDSQLTPQDAQRIQIIESIVEPGMGSGDEPYSHAGDEECVMVLQGMAEVQVGDERYTLRKGDALLLDPTSPHSFHNLSKMPVTLLWVTTPPLY